MAGERFPPETIASKVPLDIFLGNSVKVDIKLFKYNHNHYSTYIDIYASHQK